MDVMCYLHSHVINVSIFLTLFRLAQKKKKLDRRKHIKFNTLDFYNHKPKGGWFEIELKADFANRSNQILS